VLGSAVVQGRVTDVVDAQQIVAANDPGLMAGSHVEFV
jgi:hypothetical protein